MTTKIRPREKVGVIVIAKRVHLFAIDHKGSREMSRDMILDDITFLIEQLKSWDNTNTTDFSRCVKQMVQIAIAEASRCDRLN